MSKKYTRESFPESLDRRLSGFQADPWLAQRIIASEKGEKPVKKLSFAAVLVIVLLCILVTGAVAAAMNIFGLGDFFAQYAQETGATLSENYEESIRKSDTTVETDYAAFTVDETYYDEFYVRLTVTVRLREDVFLINQTGGELLHEDDLWSVYNQFEPETTTIGEYARENHGGRVAAIEAYLNPCADEEPEWEGEPAWGSFRLNEDGSVTVLYDWETGEYLEQKPEREAMLTLYYYTAEPMAEDDDSIIFHELEPETVKIPLTLYFSGNEKLICDEGTDFPEAGIRITKLVMTITPVDINCQMDYIITDEELFSKAQPEDTILQFKFVRPDSEEPEGYREFPTGVNGSFVIHTSDDPDYHHGVFSVSRDALGDQYLLMGYNRFTRQTYGPVKITVKPME